MSVKVRIVEAVIENDKGRFSYREIEASDSAVISDLFEDRVRSKTSAGPVPPGLPLGTRGKVHGVRDAGHPAETVIRGVK